MSDVSVPAVTTATCGSPSPSPLAVTPGGPMTVTPATPPATTGRTTPSREVTVRPQAAVPVTPLPARALLQESIRIGRERGDLLPVIVIEEASGPSATPEDRMRQMIALVRSQRSEVVAFGENPPGTPPPLPAPPSKTLDRAALSAGASAFSLFIATGIAPEAAVAPLATATVVAIAAMGVLKVAADRRRSVR